MAVADHSTPLPNNVHSLGLSPVPQERRNPEVPNLKKLPEKVVWLRNPAPSWQDYALACLSPEMEAILALIKALDHRTKSGRLSSKNIRDLVFENLQVAYADERRLAGRKALARLADVWFLERGQ